MSKRYNFKFSNIHLLDIMGRVVEVKDMLQHPKHTYRLANIDGLTEDDNGNPAILEVKTAGVHRRGEWENGIPVYYETQVQHYLAVTGVPTLHGRDGLSGGLYRRSHRRQHLQAL